MAAVDILYMMHRDVAEVVDDLIGATSDRSQRVRRKAYVALGNIGPQPGVTRALIAGLQRKDTPSDALQAFDSYRFEPESFGPEAEQAIPSLINMLKDKNPMVRAGVVMALASIGPPSRRAVTALVKEAMSTRDERVVEAIGKMGPYEEVVTALAESMPGPCSEPYCSPF